MGLLDKHLATHAFVQPLGALAHSEALVPRVALFLVLELKVCVVTGRRVPKARRQAKRLVRGLRGRWAGLKREHSLAGPPGSQPVGLVGLLPLVRWRAHDKLSPGPGQVLEQQHALDNDKSTHSLVGDLEQTPPRFVLLEPARMAHKKPLETPYKKRTAYMLLVLVVLNFNEL